MQKSPTFPNWQAVLAMVAGYGRCSKFFKGHTADTVADQKNSGTVLLPSQEALFTQSNARVLLGQTANGSLRFVALPTQVYPAPTGMGEFGLGPGMFHHFDVAFYLGNLSYQVLLQGSSQAIDLAAEDGENETWYSDHFLPVTRVNSDGLEMALISFAPVAPDARTAALSPAPLPGPAGAVYLLILRHHGANPLTGKVILKAGDMLLGHYEDAAPAMRSLKRPQVDVRQGTLILSRPEGSVGIQLHNGTWTRVEAPFQSECSFTLQPGEVGVFETHIALGQTYRDVMPEIYTLHLRSSLEWLNLTAGFWRERLGDLQVSAQVSEEAEFSRDIFIRSVLDNFNCLQTDAQGNLVAHWQGAPSHGYGTVWGIDVEPTAVSIVHICPELALQVLRFFMTRSRAPIGTPEHSVPILVAPIIIARQWLQVSGDTDYLRTHPEIMEALEGIMRDLLALKALTETLFPSRYSSDGPVGRRYDYGTNVKVWYAFDSMAYILRQLGEGDKARGYFQTAQAIREAVRRTMTMTGPFGMQISGGTNLGEEPGTFYLPEGTAYYDGEDTSSMLAPVYGFCEFTDETWINLHRFARSLWCAHYDPEMDTLMWCPGEPAVFDGTALFSRLSGSVTLEEMREALKTLRSVGVDEVTGSQFWWPHGVEYKRALTRCSQGQGAWAWQYLQQWLGLKVDAPAHMLTLAPRGLLAGLDWDSFCSGANRFDIHWSEETGNGSHQAVARIRSYNDTPWTVQVGFRQPGRGACGDLAWQTRTLEPGEEAVFTWQTSTQTIKMAETGMESAVLAKLEGAAFGEERIIFKRYGPALLWGYWDANQMWDFSKLPLALRFVIGNGTPSSWTDVTVSLTCPPGWMAQGREPRHWTNPDHLSAGVVRLELGNLPAFSKTAAPFWVREHISSSLVVNWFAPDRPFHAASQPGEGITLRATGITQETSVTFMAELSAKTANGQMIQRSLAIPVKII